MKTVEKSIEVARPIPVVYHQWTQFEEFPRFMEGVKEVRQLDDKTLHWKAEMGGQTEEWDAEILEQIPEQRIVWRSITGARNSGSVHFRALGPNSTRVTVHLDYDPKGALENVGDALGVVSAQVSADLRRFKEFIENKSSAPGAWEQECLTPEIKLSAALDRGGAF